MRRGKCRPLSRRERQRLSCAELRLRGGTKSWRVRPTFLLVGVFGLSWWNQGQESSGRNASCVERADWTADDASEIATKDNEVVPSDRSFRCGPTPPSPSQSAAPHVISRRSVLLTLHTVPVLYSTGSSLVRTEAD